MAKDSELISRAKSGDEEAFADLMRAYYAFVYRIVIEIVSNPHDAEEVVQDTFLNAYCGLGQIEERARFRNWLAKIARNRALNWRREQRADTVPIDDVGESALQAADSLDERLIRDEQRELIRRAMSTLSQKDRDIARAYYLDGASYDELIRTHGLSYKAISFRLSRAKRVLTKRMQHLLNVVLVPPVITLKKISSGGLTAMKIGTAPKITVGVIAIIALAFFGSRQLLSPEKDSSALVEVTSSKPNQAEQSAPVTDTNRRKLVTVPSRAEEPQISAEEMDQIEDFFAQLEADDAQSDTGQLAEAESRQDADEGVAGNTHVLTENAEQSAEEVMNAYLKALKDLDVDGMRSLMVGDAREDLEADVPIFSGELPEEILSIFDEAPEEVVELMLPMIREMMSQMLKQMLGQAEIVKSEYVGDEFHFRLRVPLRMPVLEALEFPGGLEPPESQQLLAELPESDISLYKMRKEDGAWRIYKQ